MDIEYFGANCLKLSHKKVSVVIDDNLKDLGGPIVAKKATVSVYTQLRFNTGQGGGFIIDGPGEYEVAGVSVLGFAKKANVDEKDEKTAVVYKIILNGISVVVLGLIHPQLNDEQLERLGTIDVLAVPVGGNGLSMDAKSAAKLVRDIDPKIVIPTHYQETGLKFEVPQASVEEFFKEMSVTPERTDSIKLKPGQLPLDKTDFYHLKRVK